VWSAWVAQKLLRHYRSNLLQPLGIASAQAGFRNHR
jgi:hypothetical protein